MENLRKMPFDWSNRPGVSLGMAGHARLETELSLQLDEQAWVDFKGELKRVFKTREAELKLVLPGNWTVYWKARSGESRVLLAHPEKDQWVGTVAWSEDRVDALLGAFESASDADGTAEWRLSEQDRLTFPSNLDVRIVVTFQTRS